MITFKKNQSLNSSNIFSDYFIDIVDDLQLAIDKKKKSSEVHILYKL